jgi:hypothetical protein
LGLGLGGDAGGEVGVELAGAGGFARGGEAGYDDELCWGVGVSLFWFGVW